MKYWGFVVVVLYLFILLSVLLPLGTLIVPITDPGVGWKQQFVEFTRNIVF